MQGIANVVAVVLLSVAIGTSKWSESIVVRNIAKTSANATKDTSFTAGFKYMGLFRGCEEKKYGVYFVARSRCFNG